MTNTVSAESFLHRLISPDSKFAVNFKSSGSLAAIDPILKGLATKPSQLYSMLQVYSQEFRYDFPLENIWSLFVHFYLRSSPAVAVLIIMRNIVVINVLVLDVL